MVREDVDDLPLLADVGCDLVDLLQRGVDVSLAELNSVGHLLDRPHLLLYQGQVLVHRI